MNTTHAQLTQDGTAQTTWASPLGPLLLARTAQGLAGAWFAGQKDFPPPLPAPERATDPLLVDAITALAAYFAGKPSSFAHLPLDLRGTPFQQAVWHALLHIPCGTLSTYTAVAQAVGSPHAVRAVGGAVARNPVSVIVPCHRVVGQQGSLTGYAGGLDRKQALLRLEGSLATTQPLTARLGTQQGLL
jgi:methylated-DNA-[protein]-cysteine S-methyltransferase